MATTQPTRVLFVCLGNICRSPMAEGMFIHHITQKGIAHQFHVDSAGTSGHHEGERADHRMRKTAEGHGITLHSRSRPVRPEDFRSFDHIVAMDHANLRDLERMMRDAPGATATLHLMRDHEPGARNLGVPDPYYGGQDGFEEVYHILDRATSGFLQWLQANP